MTWRRHGYSALAAMIAFVILSITSASWGRPAMIALGVLAGVLSLVYLHYRRRLRARALVPVTPSRDDRIIPPDVRVAVIARDKGRCQLRYSGICLVDREIQIDHIYPWSKGGSSKDPSNLQCACGPCNRHKSNKVPGGLR